MCYLYCNSGVSSVDGQHGFVQADGGIRFDGKLRTTTEYAFAMEFNSFEAAEHFVKLYKLCVIVFQRKDLC